MKTTMKTTTKNNCLKTVTRENAYEVWQSADKQWTWYVLKKWQSDDSKEYARWHCLVTSPFVGDRGEFGDVYAADVMMVAKRIK